MRNLNNSNVCNIISTAALSRKSCYKECLNELNTVKAGEYYKTALDLTFDELFKHQINTMIGEINHYFIFKNSDQISVEEIEELENALIDKSPFDVSVKGVLKYLVGYCCRKEFIKLLHQYARLYAVS
jgi:hypothetical protein